MKRILFLIFIFPQFIFMQSDDAYNVVNDMHHLNYSQPTILPDSVNPSSIIENANEIEGNTLSN